MKCYKGFDKDFKCRGLQYEVGQTYEEDTAKICENGFHYCHSPLDVLDYYPLIDDDGKLNQFAEVEPLDEELTNDGKKFCTRKIKIGAKLSLKGLVKASIDFIFENYKDVKNEAVQASGDYGSTLASNGSFSQLASSGHDSQLASSGYESTLVSSGSFSKLASSGNGSQLVSSGSFSQLASSGGGSQLVSIGYDSKLASSGGFSKLASSGHSSQLASSGFCSSINSMGEKAVVANIGIYGKAKAKLGSFIILAEYNEEHEPIAVKSHKVDGKAVKADTWYTLKNGKFTEVV